MFIKRKYLVVLMGALLTTPMGLFAQTKIGLLNVMRVMVECSEGKLTLGEFQKKVEAKKIELEKKNNELQDLQKQLQSQARTLNDESRAALAKSIEVKTTELQRSQDDAQKEFGALQNEILGRLGNKIAPVVQQFAKDNGFAIVVDTSNQNSQVVYFDPSIDVTDEIIKKVDASLAAGPPPRFLQRSLRPLRQTSRSKIPTVRSVWLNHPVPLSNAARGRFGFSGTLSTLCLHSNESLPPKIQLDRGLTPKCVFAMRKQIKWALLIMPIIWSGSKSAAGNSVASAALSIGILNGKTRLIWPWLRLNAATTGPHAMTTY